MHAYEFFETSPFSWDLNRCRPVSREDQGNESFPCNIHECLRLDGVYNYLNYVQLAELHFYLRGSCFINLSLLLLVVVVIVVV